MPAAEDHSQHMIPSNDPAAAKTPWVIQHSPMPNGGAPLVGIATVEPHLAMLERAKYGEGVRIFYPDGPGGTFMINYIPDKAEGQRTIHVDPANGRVLDDIGWQQYSPAGRWIEWGTMLHMGRQYGVANQLANLAICLFLIGSVVSALVHWWKRRPAGSVGAPSTRSDSQLPKGLKFMLTVLAVVFPLVGATMMPVLLYGYFRRWRSAQRYLG